MPWVKKPRPHGQVMLRGHAEVIIRDDIQHQLLGKSANKV